ncbi:MAG: acyl-ACP--UDP-N-acetylglucosamine O-acyltransferase [Gammaproteobacteria bacterium]|nr:acyl-ACP--UDP-N-acetylglucosamine O-acyltransferase [Gammaproteobacteria bacterium]
MATQIHPSAIIEDGAEIGDNVSVGPFSIIGSQVKIGDGTKIDSHVVVEGDTHIGAENHLFAFCAIGGEPQSLAYAGEPTQTRIGDRNVFRENMTVSRGSPDDEGITSVGNDNYFMAYSHIAHDCHVGSNVTFANCACLGGHVDVGDYVVLGGYALVHQFCRIGDHCFTAGAAVCIQDVPPFTLVAGNRAITHGINIRGLKRRGFSADDITELKRAYKIIYRTGLTMKDALKEIESRQFNSPHVKVLTEFIQGSERGVIR